MQSPSHHDSSHSGAAGSPEPPPLSSSSNIKNVVIPNEDNNTTTTTTTTGAHSTSSAITGQPSHIPQSVDKHRASGSAQGKNVSNGQPRALSKNGMGEGIVNQSMKQDLENWIAAIGLARDIPIHVVGYFGQCQDLSMFERVSPTTATTGSEGDDCRFDVNDERSPVYYERSRDLTVVTEGEAGATQERGSAVWNMGIGDPQATGDIQLYVDRAKNTVMLQHEYLYDTQEMLSMCLESLDTVKKDRASLMKWMHDQEFESHRALLFLFLVSQVIVHTSPDMNIDPQMISVLLALSTIKRQIMQELDRFMTICWDRIGISAPESHHHHYQQQRGGPNSMANIFTPGKCVPVLVVVIERVPVTVPWLHEPGASENQFVEHLKQQVLKKSVDALQTRLRYVFRASRLIQSIDPPAGMFDARQLFVLPSPSSTPFVHVIPYFTEQLDLPPWLPMHPSSTTPAANREILDPADVLRQTMRSAEALNSGGRGGSGSKKHRERKTDVVATTTATSIITPTATSSTSTMTRPASLLGMPTLREFYDAAVRTRDQPLVRTGIGTGLSGDGTGAHDLTNESSPSSLSLGSLYLDYTGPLLRQFVDGWVKNVKSPGGYGNVVGKRNAGSVEAPSLQQWMVGCLGACEALGISSLTSPPPPPALDPSGANADAAESAERIEHEQPQPPPVEEQSSGGKFSKMNVGGGRRSGSSKRYSQRCSNMVQKKILDYVLTDDVMEELYGQKPDLAATTTTARAHSERYHQLKADQASKLFQSLAHRR